jgi:hypothetical protein
LFKPKQVSPMTTAKPFPFAAAATTGFLSSVQAIV